jgi:serine protease AprX
MSDMERMFIRIGLYVFFTAALSTGCLIARDLPSRYWIFFTGKGILETEVRIPAEDSGRDTHLSDRALQRRAKLRSIDRLTDIHDLPVAAAYREQIEAITDSITVVSRWLNAVSAPLTPDQKQAILDFPFVTEVQPVGRMRRPRPVPGDNASDDAGSGLRDRRFGHGTSEEVLSYGLSEYQVTFHDAHLLHRYGITGAGVLIGFLDTGYRWENHQALRNASVTAVRDFVAENYPEDAFPFSHYDHGTLVFSVVGGYHPDRFIGISFDSDFLLGATEDIRSETPVEEDFWVAGLEWMESLGVDIVTSSLGYSTFDEPFAGYTPGDMDGRTAVTTIAAERAFERGVLVVASAGNEGGGAWRIVTSPADGKHVVAVGAIGGAGTIAPFSSRGPTADGRIKPDLSALGISVVGAGTGGEDSYRSASGTSLSAPLVSGIAGLVLSARRDLTVTELRNALLMSSRRTGQPDNDYGWGILDAHALLAFPVVRSAGGTWPSLEIFLIGRTGIVEGSGRLHYRTSNEPEYRIDDLRLREPLGATASGLYEYPLPAEVLNQTGVSFIVTVQDSSGETLRFPTGASQEYFLSPVHDLVTVRERTIPERFMVYQNYPNPFNDRTVIRFDIPNDDHVTITVYDLLGRLVRTLTDEFYLAGEHEVVWQPAGRASGVYWFRIAYGAAADAGRMLYLR